LLAIFVGRLHCSWCPKSIWPPLGASMALKMNKSELEARKLWPPEVGGVVFLEQVLME